MKDKIAIVTGAGRGIGRAVALALAREGASVTVSDVDLTSAQAVASEIVALSGRSFAIATDVSSEKQVARLIEATLEQFAKIDILVNNAGVISTGPLLETSIEV